MHIISRDALQSFIMHFPPERCGNRASFLLGNNGDSKRCVLKIPICSNKKLTVFGPKCLEKNSVGLMKLSCLRTTVLK